MSKKINNCFFLDKKAIEMGFNWLFAVIIGAFIIFIAIYAVFHIFEVGQLAGSIEAAAKFTALLDPAEAGIASGSSDKIEFNRETRTYYECDEQGDFGRNSVAFSEKNLGKWGEKGGAVTTNKYVFADEVEEGDLYILSQPFDMPFKVADLLFISSKKYCFINAPNEIRDEVKNIGNIEVIEGGNCDGIKVCFDAGNCEINVINDASGNTFEKGWVKKGSNQVYYTNSLLYGAIFSNKEVYDCNVKRLMKKTKILSDIYVQKINLVGCGENIRTELIAMQSSADSANLIVLSDLAETIDSRNKYSSCKIY